MGNCVSYSNTYEICKGYRFESPGPQTDYHRLYCDILQRLSPGRRKGEAGIALQHFVHCLVLCRFLPIAELSDEAKISTQNSNAKKLREYCTSGGSMEEKFRVLQRQCVHKTTSLLGRRVPPSACENMSCEETRRNKTMDMFSVR